MRVYAAIFCHKKNKLCIPTQKNSTRAVSARINIASVHRPWLNLDFPEFLVVCGVSIALIRNDNKGIRAVCRAIFWLLRALLWIRVFTISLFYGWNEVVFRWIPSATEVVLLFKLGGNEVCLSPILMSLPCSTENRVHKKPQSFFVAVIASIED